MIDIPYTDVAITYSGRWVEQHESMGSAWQGSQIRFNVQGSRKLSLNLRVIDKEHAGPTFAVINLDGGNYQLLPVSADAEVFDGQRTVSIELPSTEKHDVILKLFALPDKQWAGDAYVGLQSMSVDSGARIENSQQVGAVPIEFVGDSWMAVQNDWPYMLDRSRYNVIPVSYGGADITGLERQYLYDSAGHLAESTVPVKAVVIGSGVNDFNGKVKNSQYKEKMLSLVGKVRELHPEVPIILLQAPSNLPAKKDYGGYGVVLKEIASERKGVTYLPVPQAAASKLPWTADNSHLTYEGRKAFAELIQPLLDRSIAVAE